MIDFLRMEEMSELLNDDIDGFGYWFFIRDKVYSKISELEQKNSGNHQSVTSKIDQTFGTNVMGLTNRKIVASDIFYLIKNIIWM